MKRYKSSINTIFEEGSSLEGDASIGKFII